MAKKNVKGGNEVYKGFKGWEVAYLKKAEAYGHLRYRGEFFKDLNGMPDKIIKIDWSRDD